MKYSINKINLAMFRIEHIDLLHSYFLQMREFQRANGGWVAVISEENGNSTLHLPRIVLQSNQIQMQYPVSGAGFYTSYVAEHFKASIYFILHSEVRLRGINKNFGGFFLRKTTIVLAGCPLGNTAQGMF